MTNIQLISSLAQEQPVCSMKKMTMIWMRIFCLDLHDLDICKNIEVTDIHQYLQRKVLTGSMARLLKTPLSVREVWGSISVPVTSPTARLHCDVSSERRSPGAKSRKWISLLLCALTASHLRRLKPHSPQFRTN